ncbi:MAG: hypothetical protein FWD57_12585, partial [Polyangiaceae bacterium]|nr:hypothetical protein [Polyangiaceae bacterium]
FAFRYGKQTVYEEQDRERSLAFRFFRDGVRRLHFGAGVTWDDFLSLLEVLAVRCTGVRQHEEDLVTMLRKASFQYLTIESVEGYAPDEEMPENDALVPVVDGVAPTDPVPDWDQPLPNPAAVGLEYVEIESHLIDALRAEQTPGAVATQAVRSVFEILQTANSLGDREFLAQLVPLVCEVQHYLVVEGNLEELARLDVVYRDAFGDGRRLPMLSEEGAFDRVVGMVRDDDSDDSVDLCVPPALYHLIGAPTPAMLPHALDMLCNGAEGLQRKALLEIIACGASIDSALLISQMRTAPPGVLRDLFAILARVAPAQRLDAAFDLLSSPHADVQLELVDVIVHGSTGLRLARGMHALLNSPHEAVRLRAIVALGDVGGAKAVPMLADRAKRNADDLSLDEAATIGSAIGRACPEEALPILLEWVDSKSGFLSVLSMLRKETPGSRNLAIATALGLSECGLTLRNESRIDDALKVLCTRWARDHEIASRIRAAFNRLRKERSKEQSHG